LSVKDLIARFEKEAQDIESRMDDLKQRHDVISLVLKELKGASGKRRGRKPATAKKARKTRGRKRGGMTVRDAILKTVFDAKDPLPAKEIIAGAEKLSGGAEASIRTQINALSRQGLLKQIPYEGRGFRYGPGAKAEPKAAGAKKAEKK